MQQDRTARLNALNVEAAERFDRFAQAARSAEDTMVANSWTRLAVRERQAILDRTR